jgi:TonB-dependent starch-binding outer membrane protein SusC
MAAAVALLCVWAQPAAAQATGALRGQVVDAATQRPLVAAQVHIAGTNRGGLTDARGQFLIPAVPVGTQRVQVHLIGYGRGEQTVTVAAEETVTLTFELAQAAVELDAVIVTGTAGATQRRALGNAVSSINAAAVTEAAPVASVTQLLTGRTPGLTVMASSGQVGTAANFRIRGAASLSAGNHPVFYVDGVRVRSGSQSGFGTSNNTTRETSALDAINPDDIETIEVIKGPAAATLYGADAAAGVIHIITKRGQAGSGGIRFSGRVEVGQNDWHLGMRENYTLCARAGEMPHVGMRSVNMFTSNSWPGCHGMNPDAPWQERLLRQTPLAEQGVLKTGPINRYSLNARGGGERFTFFVSGDHEKEEGVFHNNWFDRISGRANFTVIPTDQLTFDMRVGYTRYNSQQPNNDNASNGWLRNSWRGLPGTNAPYADGWRGLGPDEMRLYDNTILNERWILGATAEYRPFTWFRNRLILGFDAGDRQNTIFYGVDLTGRAPYGTSNAKGYISHFEPETRDYTVDYSGTFEHNFARLGLSPELTSAFSFGMQYSALNYRSTQVVGEELVADPLRLISSAATTRAFESRTESRSLGFFVQEMLGWKNRLFVTGAVRVDDHSAFGANFSRIYYPKVSVAHVISEEPFFNVPLVDNLKLRFAYGHAGNAPAPFEADRTFSATSVVTADNEIASALEPGSAGNPDLRAERGTEYEVGFDASILNNAVGLEVTYYNMTTRDALMTEPVSPASGFTGSVLRNVGTIRNSGIEVALFGSPVRRPSFTWDTRVGFSTNNNELVSFGELARDFIPVGYRNSQRHVAGYPLGGYWAEPILRNSDGSLQIDAAGRPILGTELYFVGSSAPTREASFTNTFILLGNLQVYTHMDYKGGHYLFNMSEQTSMRDDLNHRKANDPTIDRDEWLMLRWGGNAPFMERADFIKLREVSMRYSVPGHLTRRFGADGLGITLAGRNLAIPWTRYKSGVDPEVNIGGPAAFTRAESNSVPMIRQIVATVDFRF